MCGQSSTCYPFGDGECNLMSFSQLLSCLMIWLEWMNGSNFFSVIYLFIFGSDSSSSTLFVVVNRNVTLVKWGEIRIYSFAKLKFIKINYEIWLFFSPALHKFFFKKNNNNSLLKVMWLCWCRPTSQQHWWTEFPCEKSEQKFYVRDWMDIIQQKRTKISYERSDE